MTSNDRTYRLSYEPLNRRMVQEWQLSGCFDKSFGRYHIVQSKYNGQEERYCKHGYHCYPSAESHHYVNLTGWYYSLNPDSSEEKLHLKQKKAEYRLPNGFFWEDWSDKVPWDKLPAIPDRCIENISRPPAWFWTELERRERERPSAERTERQYKEWCGNDVLSQAYNNSDWDQHSEWNMPIVDENVTFRSASETSVESESDTSGIGSSTGQTSREGLPENKTPQKKRIWTSEKCTGVKSKPHQWKTARPEKEPEERNEQKRRKKAESTQTEKQKNSPDRMQAQKRKLEEQESQDNAEGTKPRNKKHKTQIILEVKHKKAGWGNPSDVPNRKRKANNEDKVAMTPIAVKKKRRHMIQESSAATGAGIC
ncbi:uncharacterized protein N7500_008609 [Penicillium coprophilum]|uniref:uncharacterized protein n=1 Tax=Penicillium coprophilum TaxID=36646 RepID=UPI00238B95A1|nr:uncharacterized protein N7500_008609 [Penicillium coprophilum]KAJ5158958.1 hypothetical protein N7500_008609 [Penicillium coprophilum]